MLGHPTKSADLRVLPTPQSRLESKVAVVLNANARGVSDRVIHSLSHTVSEEDLFVSHSRMEARRIAKTLLEREYPIVFCGGGDGTFVVVINELFQQLEHFPKGARRLPRFGMLKLGTGNGLAALLHSSSARNDGILDDVLRARAGDLPRVQPIDLLRVEGTLTPFAGLGADGKLLNDYVWVQNHLARGVLKGMLTGRGGYLSAIALKTLPYYVSHSASVHCEVINGGKRPAFKLGRDGAQIGEPILPGAVLFEGPLMMAAAATIPFYGFEFRMFPFAGRRRGMMHLRLGTMPTAAILTHLPALWNGRWFPKGIHDFHVEEAVVRFAKPMPLQIGGDPEGYRDQITFSLAERQVELIDFTVPVN
jgi:diacylglycerol kinase family enzyme